MLVFGKSEAEQDCTLRRGHFGHDIMFGQVYFIIGRSGNLAFVTEPTGTFFFVKLRFACYGHDGELPVIVDPRTGLMGLFESLDFVGCVRILPSVSHLTGLWCPEIHSPWAGNGGISVPG